MEANRDLSAEPIADARSSWGRAVAMFTARAVGGRPAAPASARGGQVRFRHRVSIRVLVLAITIALLTPAVAFLAKIVQQHDQEHHRQVSETGERLAGEITGRLEQEFAAAQTTLAVFGSSGWLEAGELQRLHRRARQALAGTGLYLIVLDENLDQLLNTRVEFGSALPKTAERASALQALQSGRPVVSNLFLGRVAETPVFNVLRPVKLQDGRRRVLILTRDADSLAGLLAPKSVSSGWSYAVLDGAGNVVHELVAPGRADESVPAGCLTDPGRYLAVRAPDDDRYIFLQSVDRSPWNVCVWAPVDTPGYGLGMPGAGLYSMTLVWIGLALVVATVLSSLVSRAITDTARMADAIGSGREMPASPSMISEIDDVRQTLASAAEDRNRNERRLELLLGEMAHRAKNQISLTSSLVQLCAKSASSAQDLKEDVMGRLVALGRSIEVVTGKGPDSAPLTALVRAQLGPFLDPSEHRLDLHGDDLIVSERAAQSLGLVLHELATNASKHGAWAQPHGKVAVSWQVAGGQLQLSWSETGALVRAPEHRGFGTTLIETLVEKGLHGKIQRRFSVDEFCVRILLPLESIRHRPDDGEGGDV